MIEQYKKIKKLKNFNLKSEPIPFKNDINSNDIKRGYINRYFCQKSNDNLAPVTEVSKSNYSVIQKNPLFKSIKLKWRIDGTKEQIKDSNRASISENLRKMPQLKNRLVNLLEYSKK